MKTKEIRELSLVELEKKIREAREEILQHRLRKQSGQLENVQLLNTIRRDIARMETIATEKRKSAAVSA